MKTCPHIFFIPLVSSLLVIQHMPKEITLTHIIPKRRKKHLLAFVGGQHSQIKAFFFRLPCFWQPEASVLRGSPWMTTTLKFIGRLSSGNVWFVLPHKSCWKHGIYQFRCHSDAIAAQLRDLQFSALFAVCSVSDRVKAASICAPCHYKSGEDNEAALLSRATLPHSDHSTVW